MENWANVSASRTEGSMEMSSPDHRGDEDNKSYNEIMIRRIKNRERQRRYRARKRLEADLQKNSSAIVVVNHQPPPPLPQIVHQQLQLVQVPDAGVDDFSNNNNRILCRRDWKKDARKTTAQTTTTAIQVQDNLALNGCSVIIPALISTSVSETPPPTCGNESRLKNSVSLDSSEAERTASGRRHWKAEARNKKN